MAHDFDLLLVAAPSLRHDDEHRATADVLEALTDWTEPMPEGELWVWAYVFACARNDNGPALTNPPRAAAAYGTELRHGA